MLVGPIGALQTSTAVVKILTLWNWKMDNFLLLAPWKKSYDPPGQCIKKQSYHFAYKGQSSQSYSFSSSHVQMWKLDPVSIPGSGISPGEGNGNPL